jgi:hypothetical protein
MESITIRDNIGRLINDPVFVVGHGLCIKADGKQFDSWSIWFFNSAAEHERPDAQEKYDERVREQLTSQGYLMQGKGKYTIPEPIKAIIQNYFTPTNCEL